MQTFLPSPDFATCGKVLDKVRLSKQLVETQQITNCILDGGAWQNHPAVRMWADYLPALGSYQTALFEQWVARGGSDTHKSYHKTMERIGSHDPASIVQPHWLGDEPFHASHRSRLLLKGLLDTARRRIRDLGAKPDDYCKTFFESPRKLFLRDLTVAQVTRLHNHFNDMGVNHYDNYYEQFFWSESASDTYVWPVELYTNQ